MAANRRDHRSAWTLLPALSMSPHASTRGLSISILASCFALTTLASPARAADAQPKPAEETKVGGVLQAFSLVSLLTLDGRTFVDRAPYRAAGLRFQGDGRAIGGGFEMLLNVDRYRIGFDATLFSVGRVELGHKPFGPDLRASLSSPFGSDLALSFGRELALGPVHPYLDLRLGVSLLKWNIDAHSNNLGPLTSLGGTLVAPLVAPRVGVSFRLGSHVNLDVAATASPLAFTNVSGVLGLTRVGGFLGLGVYTDSLPKDEPPRSGVAPKP